MTTGKQDELISLRNALGCRRPDSITQEPFEGNDAHLRRLVRLGLGERAAVKDLWEYTQDLRYSGNLQEDLFIYLLPFCLAAWHDDLRGRKEYGGFVEQFYPVLATPGFFEKHFSAKQAAAISMFMQKSIMLEIDDQHGLQCAGPDARPRRWIWALTTHGVVLPDMDVLWREWWSLGTVGRAIAVVQYVSCLMYEEHENPVFAAWTPDGGGGPPCLWEFAGHLYNHRWLPANVTFRKSILDFRTVGEMLTRAVECLVGQPEHGLAIEIQADLPLCERTLGARCEELPRRLEANPKATDGWS